MSFEDLEKIIGDFLIHQSQSVLVDNSVQQRTKKIVLQSFEDQRLKNSPWWFFWKKPLQVSIAFCLVIFGSFINRIFPESYAGEIQSNAGLVEIIRNEEILTIPHKKSFRLRVGDLVQVDSDSSATIKTKKGLETNIKGGTKLRMADPKNVFVQEGSVEVLLSEGSIISTHRGFISSPNQGNFLLDILPTGEARVVLENQEIEVSDWLDNKTLLSIAGEQVRLKTGTKISAKKVPTDLKLSDTQLELIASKLVIARSKLFTGLEKSLTRRNTGRKDIESAEMTFRSLVQVINNTDRQLNVYGSFNTDLVENDVVIETLRARITNPVLIQEAESFLALLKVLERKNIDLAIDPLENKMFQRYVLTDFLKNIAPKKEIELFEYIKSQYVTTTLRKIINHESKFDQANELKNLVQSIPKNHPLKAAFLTALRLQLDLDLQAIILEN